MLFWVGDFIRVSTTKLGINLFDEYAPVLC